MSGDHIDPRRGALTFSDFYREWSARQVWVGGTRANMDRMARSVPFAEVPLADLRVSHIEGWVAVMAAELAPSTVRARYANMRTVIRAAVADRRLKRDMTERVRLPRTRKAAAAMTIPTAEQVGAVIRAAEPQFAALIAVCAFGGLRLGEASALKVSDVDFLRRELHVRRQAQFRAENGVAIRPPKYGSERTVYIPDSLVTLLAEHVRSYRPGGDPERWLFPAVRDESSPLRVSRQWDVARDRAGVDCRLHDLRHFYASGLIRAGCDVVTVQRALGHSSATTTLSTYSHLWPDANDRTRAAAGQLLEASLGPQWDRSGTAEELAAANAAGDS